MLVMGPHWRSLFFEVIYMVGLLPLGASPRLCFSMAFHGLKAVVKHDWRTSGTPARRELAAHSETLVLGPDGW